MSNVVIVRRDGAELVEHEMQNAPAEQLTGSLGELVAIAKNMDADDIALDVDAGAGKLHFRAYRRAKSIPPASSP
ncbi:hypothetical protein [Ensifer sp. SSB1]|jgi:hypothetical protein|uniref:hypothetical protein n=1 Tax=Ensifer sp. SSB1 TaxID=2795385 RepID=UPI001A530BF5|nr:hypothetical protein [Ensifer sp. SSB1]MBK5567229.1 hypothetical protein [Ensifer sp. SSB1]